MLFFQKMFDIKIVTCLGWFISTVKLIHGFTNAAFILQATAMVTATATALVSSDCGVKM